MLAERDVDPQAMALPDEALAELLGDAEQHLELVLVRAEAATGDNAARLRDKPLVMRGDPDVAARVE